MDVLARLAPMVSPVRVVSEDSPGDLDHPVNLDHQDSLGHRVSRASGALQVSSVDRLVGLEVQADRDSPVPLAAQDPRAAWEE